MKEKGKATMKNRVISYMIIMFLVLTTSVPSNAAEYYAKGNVSDEFKTTEMLRDVLEVTLDNKGIKEGCGVLERLDCFAGNDESQDCLMFNIRMPKTFTLSKEDAKTLGEKRFGDEIEKLGKTLDLVPDIDNSEFQSMAKEYVIEDGAYADFGKFIDIYENYDYNEKMKDLIRDIENTKFSSVKELTLDNRFTMLLSMMPIDPDVHSKTEDGFKRKTANNTRSLSGYSGTDARTYAQTWAYKTNNTDYGYYADYYDHPTPNNNNMWSGGTGNNKRTWYDCANFVSQCLKAGGASEIKDGFWFPYSDNDNWYYSDSKPSNSWGGASNFQQHWIARVGIRSVSSDACVGDPASLDNGGDYIADHTVIVTSVNGTATNQLLYACHTSDQFEASGKSFSTLYSSYDNIWIYAVA